VIAFVEITDMQVHRTSWIWMSCCCFLKLSRA